MDWMAAAEEGGCNVCCSSPGRGLIFCCCCCWFEAEALVGAGDKEEDQVEASAEADLGISVASEPCADAAEESK